MIAPNVPIGPNTTLQQYHDGIYSRVKLGGRSPVTRAQYLMTLREFSRYLKRTATLADLTDDNVTAYLGAKLDTGVRPASVNKNRGHLLAMWRFAARKRHTELWPDVAKLKEYKRVPKAWTLEQLSQLLTHCRTFGSRPATPENFSRMGLKGALLAGIPDTLWWYSLCLAIYETGIRIGAAIQLRCDDFDPSARKLFIRAETQKQHADQVFVVTDELAAVLVELSNCTPRDLLWPWPYSYLYLFFKFDKLLEAAGLPHGRFDKFHRIRKTSATMIELHAGRGAAVHHLGHSSPKMTEHYLDTSMLPEFQVIDKLPRPEARPVILPAVPMADLIDEYERGMMAKLAPTSTQGKRGYWRQACYAIRRVFRECGFNTTADVDPERFKLVFAGIMRSLASGRYYWLAVKAFLFWCIAERGQRGALEQCLSSLPTPPAPKCGKRGAK